MNQDIETLKSVLPALSDKDRIFASSLIKQFGEYGSLSEKQLYWVKRLAAPKEAAKVAQVGSFADVVALFETAKAKLKFPKVRLALPDGRPVVMSLAGAASKAPGTINVTDGKPFGENTWYGRVTPQGAWQASGKVDGATMTSLAALLAAFGSDPARIAQAYGKQTGACCFCSRELTDERSVSVGYGPICAGRWSLPWGEK